MVGGDDKGDDRAVELSWPDAQPVAARRAAAPVNAVPAARRPAAPPAGAAPAGAAPRTARPDGVTGAQLLSAVQQVGADVIALGRVQQRVLGQAMQELSERLASFELSGGDPTMAGALHALGQRLTSIEAAANRVADDADVIADRVDPVPDRLAAIATQVDRMTPLARAGDDAGSLLDHLNRVGSGLDEVVTLLRSRAVETGGPDDGDPFDAVVDVLASVTRRQDELAAAMADVADRLSDRSDLEAVLEWAERRERLLTERLDRIEAALPRRTGAEGAPASAIEDTLFGVLEHLTTLSSLVTGTSRASAAQLDALQRRIVQSLASFDDVRATVPKGLAERPLLSDVDVRRIADAVTESLLENVRVEAEEEDGEL